MPRLMQKLLPKFESALYWAVLTILFFIPLYFKFPLATISGTFVAIRFEDLLIAGTLVLWIIYLLLSKGLKDFLADKLNQALLLFFFVGAVSTFSGIFLTKTAVLHLGFLHYLRRIEFMMLLPLTISIIKTKRQSYVYLGVLSIVLFLVNIYALGQKFLHFPAISTTNSELSKGIIYFIEGENRVTSTFAGHYDLAVFLLMSLVIISALVFYFVKSKNKTCVLWLILLAGLSLVLLIMTAARLSFVAAIIGVTFSLLLVGKKKYVLLMGLLVLFILVYPSNLRDRFVSTFTVNIQKSWDSYFAQSEEQARRSRLNIPTLPASGPDVQSSPVDQEAPDIAPGEPLDTTALGVYRSFTIRTQVEWPRAIRAFTKNPLLGTGYSSLGLATDNDLLRSLGEVGLLGTIAFILILFEITRRVWVQYRKQTGFAKYFSAGCLAMIFAFLINSLFIDVFEASKVACLFWMILGINLYEESTNKIT